MADKEKPTKSKGQRGQRKQTPDTQNPDENPLLHIENKPGFEIYTGNLLEDPTMMIFPGYTRFDMKKEKDHFDASQLSEQSQIIIVLRYFEYICVAKFNFFYIIPLLESDLKATDVFDIVKHCLRNKLLLNAPSFDNIYELEIQYTGFIKY